MSDSVEIVPAVVWTQEILPRLGWRDWIQLSATCKFFYGLTRDPHLWRSAYETYFDLPIGEPPHDWLDAFAQRMADRVIPYGDDIYLRTRRVWASLEALLEVRAPGIYESLKEGIPEEEMQHWNIPKDVKCFYRFHNGQELGYMGLFGGYASYDHMTDFRFMPMHPPESAGRGIPIAACGHTLVWKVSDSKKDFGHLVCEAMYPVRKVTFLADSLLDYMEQYVQKLQGEHYKFDGESIKLFDYSMPRGSDCTTHGIRVQVGTVFMPELSTRDVRFSYEITMSMEPDSIERRSRLSTRHWTIRDGERGKEEHVDGPGVIGLYPEMFPGARFSYASRCGGSTLPITMQGSFTMVREDGSTFDITVAPFVMDKPRPRASGTTQASTSSMPVSQVRRQK